jgi:Flp pilus assembly protein TadB
MTVGALTVDHPWPAMLVLAAALLLWSPGEALRSGRARALRSTLTGTPARPPAHGSLASAARRRWLLAGAAGGTLGLLLGGVPGIVAAIGITVAGERVLRRAAPDPGRAVQVALVRELPAACDLLAVCLAAGLPVGPALAAVGETVPAPLGPEFRGVAGLYRLGADPRRAWADAAPELAALGRVMVRAGESGSTAVSALGALAGESRAAARAATDAAVRRAGVWVLAPLGACFLPAFVCLGVVPLVLGIAGDVFR